MGGGGEYWWEVTETSMETKVTETSLKPVETGNSSKLGRN